MQPNAWLEAAERETGEKLREALTPEDQSTEMLLMGLRLSEGISLSRFEALAGAPLNQAQITELEDLGMLATFGDRLMATQKGRFVLNSVLAKLLGG